MRLVGSGVRAQPLRAPARQEAADVFWFLRFLVVTVCPVTLSRPMHGDLGTAALAATVV